MRLLRHELADGKYLDKDIVNCAATLLYQLCVQHGCQDDVPALRLLVEDREAVLRPLMGSLQMDRDEAKEKEAASMFNYPDKCHRLPDQGALPRS